MYSFDESKKHISELTEHFDNNIDLIKKGDAYKEANVEDEFIKPLFRYLNWNVSNEGIRNFADREFIVQAKGKGGKEPDYLLQLDSKPYLYMEAKHPKYDLFKEIKYIWQAYSYAYSTQSSSIHKKVDFAVLTDFEEFRLFDCTFKAEPKTVNNFVSIDWKYSDYIDNFQDLWDIFEKENIRKGSLDNLYLDEKKLKQNRIPPDIAFLNDLDNEKTGWRIRLAKDVRKFNPKFTESEITSAVQTIIDRFIFLKVLSDRNIEEDFLTAIISTIDKAILKSEEGILEESCRELFSKIDKTYNGSVFTPRKLLQETTLSNKTLHSILKELLPENSRYNFKQIPVEILGTIYEQFLGKIVRFTPKSVKIEYKPEVRKDEGIYYTPLEIVEYIVDSSTEESLKKCNSIKSLLNIKICDPACGSGTFLITAYDRLLNKAKELILDKINKSKQKTTTSWDKENYYIESNGDIRLTSKLKREILINCIYGVDIDIQAIEVATNSLSLKALENARHDELYAEVNLFNQKILPNLSNNIKCGNSIIGQDILNSDNNYSIENENQVKPFNWHLSFPDVFNNGGFDVVIQNPPYIQQSMFANFSEVLKEYLLNSYCSSMGRLNTFGFFIQKGIEILKNGGHLGFIVPNTILTQEYYQTLREYILNKTKIQSIAIYDKLPFKDAVVENTSIVCKINDKIEENKSNNILIHKFTGLDNYNESIILQDYYFETYKNQFSVTTDSKLLSIKTIVESISNDTLGGILNVNQAIALKKDRAKYIFDKKISEQYKPLLDGRDINQYSINWPGLYLKYDLKAIHSCKREDIFLADEKLFFRRVSEKLIACYDTDKFYALNTLVVMTPKENLFGKINLKYILAFFNSKIANFYYKNFLKSSKKVFSEIQARQIEQLPIFIPESDDKLFNEIVSAVDAILIENRKLSKIKNEMEQEQIKNKILYIDNSINEKFYKLYNLSSNDIQIIEEHQ